jgi:Family of unknown function (DUF5519)
VTTLRARLIRQIEKLGVENRPLPGRDDGFSSLHYRDKAFAHFHNDHELDLRLSKKIIAREALSRPTQSSVHPTRSKNSPWIEIQFRSNDDVARVVELIRLAIRAL